MCTASKCYVSCSNVFKLAKNTLAFLLKINNDCIEKRLKLLILQRF